VYRDLPVNDPPEWMLKESQSVPAVNSVSKIEDIVVKINGKGRRGDIFNQENSARELIIKAGWKPVRRTGALRDGTKVEYFTRPGKRGGVSGSVIGEKYFYSFSTDCAPFEPERAYDAFGIYTILNHNGDFKEATKALNRVIKGTKNDTEKFQKIIREGFRDIKEARRAIEAVKEYRALREEVLPFCIGLEESWRLEKVVQAKIKQLEGAAPPIDEVRKWLGGGKNQLNKIPEWAEDWVYLYYHNKFFSLKTKEMISERAFNLMLAQYTDEENIGRSLTSSGLMPIYSNAIYLPGAAEEFEFEGKPCVNLFKPWPKAESSKIDDRVVEIVLEHARRRFPDEWRLLIDFMAWCIQNPGKKLAWVMFIQGAQGDGKTFWMRLMTLLMGASNTKEVDPVAVRSNFTGWAEGACFACIDEIRLSGQNRFEVMDRTKSTFTNPRISIHRKGLDPYDAPNTTNYLLLTNHKDALPLTDDDRRYCILFSKMQQREGLEKKDYFDRLYGVLKDRDTLLNFFEQWELSKNFSQFQAPENGPSRKEMIDLNKSETRMMIEEYIECFPSARNKVQVNDIFEWIGERVETSRRRIGRELTKMGYGCSIIRNSNKVTRVRTKEEVLRF